MKRYRTVADEAAAQSGRSVVPELPAILKFASLLKSERQGARMLLAPDAPARMATALTKLKPEDPVILLTGPEGGLHPAEIALAKESGWEPVSLGGAILRGDTAPLVAVSLALFTSGDLG